MGVILSPDGAAKRAGVSRRTVLRAIKRKDVQAVMDNRGRWRVDGDSLDAWAAWRMPSGQCPVSGAGAHEIAQSEAERLGTIRELGELRANLAGRAAEVAGLRELVRAVEADRDVWRELAQRPLWRRFFGRSR